MFLLMLLSYIVIIDIVTTLKPSRKKKCKLYLKQFNFFWKVFGGWTREVITQSLHCIEMKGITWCEYQWGHIGHMSKLR